MTTIDLEKIFKEKRIGSSEVKEILKKEEVHIYLAGPISFVEELQDYRKQIRDSLAKISPKLKIHDPWEREQEFLHGLTFGRVRDSEEKKNLSENVINEDLKEISSCDLVLAYFFRLGTGTAMEMFFASRILNKPVILVYAMSEEAGWDFVPLWLYGHANLIFQSKRGLYTYLRRTLEEIENEKKGT